MLGFADTRRKWTWVLKQSIYLRKLYQCVFIPNDYVAFAIVVPLYDALKRRSLHRWLTVRAALLGTLGQMDDRGGGVAFAIALGNEIHSRRNAQPLQELDQRLLASSMSIDTRVEFIKECLSAAAERGPKTENSETAQPVLARGRKGEGDTK